MEDVREERLSVRVRLKSGVDADPGHEVAEAVDVVWVCPGRLRCAYQWSINDQLAVDVYEGINLQQHVAVPHPATNP